MFCPASLKGNDTPGRSSPSTGPGKIYPLDRVWPPSGPCRKLTAFKRPEYP